MLCGDGAEVDDTDIAPEEVQTGEHRVFGGPIVNCAAGTVLIGVHGLVIDSIKDIDTLASRIGHTHRERLRAFKGACGISVAGAASDDLDQPATAKFLQALKFHVIRSLIDQMFESP